MAIDCHRGEFAVATLSPILQVLLYMGRSIQVMHVQLALLTGKCAGLVGLAVGVHYVCSPQGGSQHQPCLPPKIVS
jgi:hypothetical protein